MATMSEPLRLSIPGEPVSWARARTNGKRFFTAKPQAIAMDIIRLEATRAMAGRAILEGPLSLRAKFIYPWPKSVSEKKRRIAGAHWKTSRADLDNCLKLVNDSLNQVVWRDDAQVASATIEKQFGTTPQTIITIESLTHQAEGESPNEDHNSLRTNGPSERGESPDRRPSWSRQD